jgi:methylenetetrahydrofolate--tRNA-(uracil-5-)-methyltransferase
MEPIDLPPTCMVGALTHFISEAPSGKFQPMPPNFGLLPALPERIRDKRRRYGAYRDRALNDLCNHASQQGVVITNPSTTTAATTTAAA